MTKKIRKMTSVDRLFYKCLPYIIFNFMHRGVNGENGAIATGIGRPNYKIPVYIGDQGNY